MIALMDSLRKIKKKKLRQDINRRLCRSVSRDRELLRNPSPLSSSAWCRNPSPSKITSKKQVRY